MSKNKSMLPNPSELDEIESHYSSLIKEVDNIVQPMVEAIDFKELIRHNYGYSRYSESPFHFLIESEKKRFLMAFETIVRDGKIATAIDLGCFVPYLPVLLSKVGIKVSIVDNYSLFGDRLKTEIEKIAIAANIKMYDADILSTNWASLPQSDAVLLTAVVEHLNGSPLPLLRRAANLVNCNGMLLFEVPNIAELSRRLRLLIGKSPLPSYEDYIMSGYPFLGHNREMTVSEVKILMSEAGLRIDDLICYTYESCQTCSFSGSLISLLKKIIPHANIHGSILAKCQPIQI
jgi:hypothetical protein